MHIFGIDPEGNLQRPLSLYRACIQGTLCPLSGTQIQHLLSQFQSQVLLPGLKKVTATVEQFRIIDS